MIRRTHHCFPLENAEKTVPHLANSVADSESQVCKQIHYACDDEKPPGFGDHGLRVDTPANPPDGIAGPRGNITSARMFANSRAPWQDLRLNRHSGLSKAPGEGEIAAFGKGFP
ncbi:hypothetical protein MAIC_34660 [Mycolicibacterium aichiense]|uniref:Uncharacterized protein n=1 Tax=Mycolicibacterium aichiense TaxID=1799 RepID=A0AAD1HQA4_9MYCO|nr:hypothetical protein MAIC_34660 [Mycolicibacterium aichiense]